MDTFALALLPEESLYSWISRWATLSGYPTKRDAVKLLLGTDNKQLVSAFPSFIPETIKYSYKTSEELIKHHTILPYFRLFSKTEIYRGAEQALVSGKTEFIHTRLSLIANRVPMLEPMRFCPICSRIDLEYCGYTYWRINHQLPLVSICQKHQVKLHYHKLGRRALTLPDLSLSDIVIPVDVSTSALHLSELSRCALQYEGASLSSKVIRESYLHRLRELNLCSQNGGIKMDKLRKGLRSFWHDYDYQAPYNLISTLLSNGNTVSYPASIFYHNDSQHHPLKHLIIIGFLFDNWDNFIEHLTKSCESPPEVKKLKPPKKKMMKR